MTTHAARPTALTPATTDLVKETIARNPCLVLTVAPAGAGKSELALAVAGRPTQIVSLDDLCARVADDDCGQLATADATALLHGIVHARCSRRLTTIVDATNLERAARSPLLEIAAKHEVRAIAVALTTSLSLCLSRNAERPVAVPGALWGSHVSEPVVVRAQHAQLRTILPRLTAEPFAQILVHGGSVR